MHGRYFELKGYDSKEVSNYVSDRRGQYLGFGIVAGALESVPFISRFFTFSNTVGAALWAVANERRLLSKQKKGLKRLALN